MKLLTKSGLGLCVLMSLVILLGLSRETRAAASQPAAPTAPESVVFSGNPSSRLYFDQNGQRINLEVCADNLPGKTVSARLTRPGRTFAVVSLAASSRCVTFWDMDGAGAVISNTPYTTRAALNGAPNDAWPVPCYVATGGYGLCDTATFSAGNTFTGSPVSRLYFDQSGDRINLEVCADNLPGQTVYARLTRPGRTWDVVSQAASGRCVTFWDMDGAGAVLSNTPYTTRAALNAAPDDTWPVPCYSATGGRGLCDTATYTSSGGTPGSGTVFSGNAGSRLFFDQNGDRINLEVCADNLPGKTVYARLTRPGRAWDVVSQSATGRCVTFWDLDGAGAVLTNVQYTTRAALNAAPNDSWSVPCYIATNGYGLCDTVAYAPVPVPPPPPPPTGGCAVPHFYQGNYAQIMKTCSHPISTHGCALTSTSMVFKYYGANTTPPTLNTCLGRSACPIYWATASQNCSQGKAQFVTKVGFSWSRLSQELNQNHRPVIVGMTKPNGKPHFVVVTAGSGSRAEDYIINDPAYRGGAGTRLSYYGPTTNFTSIIVYNGTPACTAANTDTATALDTLAQMADTTADHLTLAESLGASLQITGTANVYRRTALTMTLEFSAAGTGNVNMRVWTDSLPNTDWMPFTPYVDLPIADQAYVQFTDDTGQVSDVVQAALDTTDATGLVAVSDSVFLPVIVR